MTYRVLISTPWAEQLDPTDNPLLTGPHAGQFDVEIVSSSGLDADRLRRLLVPDDKPPINAIAASSANDLGADTLRHWAYALGEQPRIISRAGVGFDNVDTEEAARQKIPVAIAVGANCAAVAEHTIGFALDSLGRISQNTALAANGTWKMVCGLELQDRTWGIIGFGSVGQAIARRLFGFGVNVLYFDPNEDYYSSVPGFGMLQSLAGMNDVGLERVSDVRALFERCDIVSVNAELNDDTRGIVDSNCLSSFERGLLVNTSRGGLVVTEDVVEWLSGSDDRFFAADVHKSEPGDITETRPFRDHMDRVLLTCHMAPFKEETSRRLTLSAIDNILIHLGLKEGELRRYVVEP